MTIDTPHALRLLADLATDAVAAARLTETGRDLLRRAADEIEGLRGSVSDAPLLVGQIVLAAGGSVRVRAAAMQSALSVHVARHEDPQTGDLVFTASATTTQLPP